MGKRVFVCNSWFVLSSFSLLLHGTVKLLDNTLEAEFKRKR